MCFLHLNEFVYVCVCMEVPAQLDLAVSSVAAALRFLSSFL